MHAMRLADRGHQCGSQTAFLSSGSHTMQQQTESVFNHAMHSPQRRASYSALPQREPLHMLCASSTDPCLFGSRSATMRCHEMPLIVQVIRPT